MKKTDFNKNVFILEQEKSKTVLYNSYTGEISKIDSKLSEINLSENTELKNYLEENYFLQKRNNVPISSHIENTRKELSATKRSASFTIHLTYSCNCKCFYCYQNDIKSSLRMDEKTEEKLYNFFEKVLEKNILESVSFIFIGGEPLICMDLMLRIREKQKRYLQI